MLLRSFAAGIILTAILATQAFTSYALAADSVPAPVGTSQAENSSVFSEKLYTDFATTYHGSSLAEPDSSRALNNEGKLGLPSTVNFDSEIGMGYKLGETLRFGAVVPFLLVPAPGDNFILGDAGIKLSQRDTLNWRGVHLSTNIILQAPTSDYSKFRRMDVGIKTTPSLRYDVPNSSITIGAWNELKEYLGATKGPTFKIWTLPYAKLQMNRSLALQVSYELHLRHIANSDTALSHYQHDLQPGLIWNITRSISVNPYLQFYSLNSIRAANTGFATYINAALL